MYLVIEMDSLCEVPKVGESKQSRVHSHGGEVPNEDGIEARPLFLLHAMISYAVLWRRAVVAPNERGPWHGA